MVLLPLGALMLATLAPNAPASPAARPDSTPPLYTNLGDYHVPISTRVPRAQLYFDQGMRLVYAFNHGEAIRAFDEAARLDPDCAICHWGAALAYGPHVNAPMDSAAGMAAWSELRQAVALAPHASPRERALIGALGARYAAAPPADRGALDSAYARAMGEVVRQFPGDLDVATLYAESLMDLRPWNYWTKDGTPQPGTDVILAQLERVIKANPDHPGACHYYIHALEAVQPARALPCAERLASLMPGAGHMVHMPGHIYIRLGRYADAIDANVHALHADESYIAAEHPAGIYPIGYYPHNYHFLAFAATMAGRSRTAIDAARALSSKVDPDMALAVTQLQPLIAYYPLTLANFGRWDEVLTAPMPRADLRLATALADYARGIAYAEKGRLAEADAMLDSVTAIANASAAQGRVAMAAGEGENKTVLDIATHALAGELAKARGNVGDAVVHYREAARLEDTFNYTEPPQWAFPIRHALGDALLRAGRAEEAARVYEEDLKRFPENGWSLYGLAKALRAGGRSDEARAVEARLNRAWNGADVVLASSRF
ncbi:MAG TPA: tetratricopeptide repeat protein [Gemmatimonadaceae bacterium]